MPLPQNATVRTMCPMNCHPTLCGMLAEVKGGALAGVAGDPDNPDSRGFLCVRGQASAEIIGNSQRLITPMIRQRSNDGARSAEDSWRSASWDEALDLIVTGMKAAGPERVGLWPGHGNIANSYGTYIGSQLLARFANLYGCQYLSPAMICWGLGGFGLGLTGALETNTKEDMSANAALIVVWGANIASQPNTARHLVAAKSRGARIVVIDVRRSEMAGQASGAEDVYLIRAGTDAALALGLMHVIIGEGLHDKSFVADHTVGFDALADHVRDFTPERAAAATGIAAARIAELARTLASVKPAMIMVGGSSLHKGDNSWQAARAISCLPALTGDYGIAGGGLGPRHGSVTSGSGLADITLAERRPAGNYLPSQMAAMTEALHDGRVGALLLFGSNILSSFADAAHLADGLARTDLVVCHELFMNETVRRAADVILPGTAWLEDVGCKRTHTHLYLMERALEPAGEARPVQDVLQGLAARLGERLADFYPWASQEDVIDAIIDHPSTGHASVASMRAAGGKAELDISHIAYRDRKFQTPSGQIEFYSDRAVACGLPGLPVYEPGDASETKDYPLTLSQGRTLTHFHSFYDHGKALPSLAARDPEPHLWLSPDDAAARGLADGDGIEVRNERGAFAARAHVTDAMPTGTVWIRDGWEGANDVTSGAKALPDAATEIFAFSVGQSAYTAKVDVVGI